MSTLELNPADMSETPLITITPAAAKQMKYLRDKKGDTSVGVRVGVKGGGCSGLSYTLQLEPESRENDTVYELDGIRVFIDPKSAKFLAGTTLDYSIKNILEGGWVFQNPNASRTCGCGTSFQPKG
jgi:iron-sulfur cluster assembly protein